MLRRLKTDYIDLFNYTAPTLRTHPEETLRTLDDLASQGKVRCCGTSTHPAWKIMESLAISERNHSAKFCSDQPPYNLLDRRIENELVPLAQEGTNWDIIWSPVVMGV
ncbi:MAG: aldo/keto reductase [Saprospiraceae bacterium]